jgi:phage tail-like protein
MLSERELQQRTLVRVPDVVGLPLRKALLLVEQAGLRVGAQLYRESYEEKDTVLEQKPQRGQMVYASEEVAIWVSRESYIKWLPAIYQRSDSTGHNVVRDLLWMIQHLFGSIESQLDSIHKVFDSYETREDFLPWLASWSAMILETDWPVNKKRRLIKKAMELYRWRGTVKGLGLFISLFTGFEPHLEENVWPYQGLRIGVSSTVGIDTVILPPVDKSHAFMVVMPHQFKDVTPQSIIRLHEIIEAERPAHTHYMLKFEEQRQAVEEREFYRIGISSGVNVGQEVVTPLPINPDTGQLELPKEQELPQPTIEPSVYELFGTKKRLLPAIEGAAKAENAPVEGREIRSSKFGFEGAREFRLDDIMRELLERAGVASDTTASPAAAATASDDSGNPSSSSDSAAALVGATREVSGSVGGGGQVEIDVEFVEAPEAPDAADSSAKAATPKSSTAAIQPSAEATAPAGPKPPLSNQETVQLGRQPLGELETVRLEKAVITSETPGGLRRDKGPTVEVTAELIDRELPAETAPVDPDGTGQPPENNSKK